jgi:hypothetical protein
MRSAMRGSNHRAGGVLVLATGLVLSVAVAACGTSAAQPTAAPPTPKPTPAITPDPHLTDPATADEIFNAIRKGDLPLSVNNATAGGPDAPIIKRINAQVANWPLVITEYRTSRQLRELLAWDPAAAPQQGDPPYAWVGMNILVEFGPVTGVPVAPDATREQQAKDLIALIDPLLWPLEQRAIDPVPTKTATPAASAEPVESGTAPSATP